MTNIVPICNSDVYIQRMANSVSDKLFFVDKIRESIENVVDFGCANGILLKELKKFFNECRHIGYDNSSEMLQIARQNNPDIEFFNNWSDIDVDPQKSLLNISSVVHEIYSYGTKEDVDIFWNRVFKSKFKYICIRDMMVSDKIVDVASVDDVKKVATVYSERLKSFEDAWGSITENKNFIHYLLKYRYVENWKRENKENYLPITKETLLTLIPKEYEIIYLEHYVLPFIQHQVYLDFGIKLNTPTHLKLILKRRENLL